LFSTSLSFGKPFLFYLTKQKPGKGLNEKSTIFHFRRKIYQNIFCFLNRWVDKEILLSRQFQGLNKNQRLFRFLHAALGGEISFDFSKMFCQTNFATQHFSRSKRILWEQPAEGLNEKCMFFCFLLKGSVGQELLLFATAFGWQREVLLVTGVFIKLWRDVKHSTINRYFAVVINWSWGFSNATTS
jgi:hypothetical protein